MSALVFDDVRTYLRIASTDDDTELQVVIDAAEATIGNLVGPLAPVAVVERLQPRNDGSLFLSRFPVSALTSIAFADGTSVDVSGLDFASGVVTYLATGVSFSTGNAPFTVTYQHGWATLPADLKMAALELVRHLWSTQRGSGNTRPRPDANVANGVPGSAYTLPIRVEQLLAPHRVPRVA